MNLVTQARDARARLRAAGAEVAFEVVPGLGHAISQHEKDRTLEWLAEQAHSAESSLR